MKNLNNKNLVLLFYFFIFVLTGCENSNENITNNEGEYYSKYLLKSSDNLNSKRIELLVKGFTKILKEKQVRDFLFDNLITSDKVENIVETTELLGKNHKIKNINGKDYNKLDEALYDVLEKNDKALFKKAFKDLKFGVIDIYFPVKEHLKLWNASENLLIAGIPEIEEDKLNEFIAYDLEGNEHVLSVKTIPPTPTLIIYPSEKGGHYTRSSSSENSNGIAFAPTLPVDPPPDPVLIYSVSALGVNIAQHYDSWPFGNLEIYLKIKTKLDGGVWSGWQYIPSGAQMYGRWLYDADPGHWHYETKEIFRTTKNFSLQVEIWEQDEYPNPDDFVADAYYNQIAECGEYRPANIMRCDFTSCCEYQLLDGVYPGSDFDFLALRFSRWQE